MITATLFFIASLIVGISLLRFIPMKWHVPELTAAGIVVGLLVSTWIGFLSCWLLGYAVGPYTTFVIMALVVLISFKSTINQPLQLYPFSAYTRSDIITWALPTLIITAVLGYLFYTHMLLEQTGRYMSGGSTWGDLALHASLITRFANQEVFTWDLPVMHGANLSYPFMVDFLSGILYRWGWSLRLAILIPGVILAGSLIQLTFFVGQRLGKKSIVGALLTLFLIVNGGIAGLEVFWQDWQTSDLPLIAFLGQMEKEYAHLRDSGIVFSNIVVDYILPQRGILFGLPLFMLATIFLWQAWHKPAQSIPYLIGVVGIGGLLPFAHAHTFLVLAGLLGYLACIQCLRNRHIFSPWLAAWIIMVSLAAPQMTWQLSSNFTESFSHFQFGWMKRVGENIVTFWLRNWGVVAIFAVLNFWIIRRWLHTKSSFYIHWYTPLLILFVITNVYVFQPHVYDNMKFMIYSYAAVCLIMSIFVGKLITSTNVLKKISGLIIVVLVTIVGVLSIARETYTVWEFSDKIDREVAAEFVTIVPPEARVLTSDQHNHFVPILTGRRIVLGYRGWLWTYGLNYQPLEQKVRKIFSGDPVTPKLLQELDISFIVIGPSEKAQYIVNEPYFTQRTKLVISNDRYHVFDVRELRQ